MVQGVAVEWAPLAAGEGADQEQECGLWLVEVGDEARHRLEVVARGYDDLCAGVEHVLVAGIEPAF